MRRRLDLGASLVGRPPVLLLDEPTTGLDPRSRLELWSAVDELRREGTTVLLTTQYLDEADRLAQRIAVIDQRSTGRRGHRRRAEGDGRHRAARAFGWPTARTRPRRPTCWPPSAPETRPRPMRPPARSASPSPTRPPPPPRCERLDDHGWKIAAIELQQPSLDDVFLSITGRPAGDRADADDHSGGTRMSAVTADPRERMTLGETFADSRVMAVRQLRKILRRPMYVVYLFVQPVIFVLLFRYVFGGAIHTGRVSYVNYPDAGDHRDDRHLRRADHRPGHHRGSQPSAWSTVCRSLPIARSAVLIGRTAADLVTNLVTLLVMVAIGLVVGFRPSQPIYDVVAGARRRAGLRLRVLVDQRIRRPQRSRTPRPPSRSASSGCSRSCSPPRPSSPPRRCRPPFARSPTSTP